MSGKEEIVEVSEDREDKVKEEIEEGIISDGDSNLPALISPVYTLETRHDTRIFPSFCWNSTLLHAENLAEGVELELFAVLLTDSLLDELVPVVDRESLGGDDQFVPMTAEVVIFGLFRDIDAVKFHLSGNLLFAFEDCQRDLEIVVSNKHAEGEKAMDTAKNIDEVIEVVEGLFNVYVLFRFFLLTTFISIFVSSF